jgi:hypothetical protein
MFILISMSVTVGVVLLGIEAANCVAYGWFASSKEQAAQINSQLDTGQLSPFDFEIISTRDGHISIVPLSLFSDYYYNPDKGAPRRVLRFTSLHKRIAEKFQQLQNA